MAFSFSFPGSVQALVVAAAFVAAPMRAQVSGAVFTTDAACEGVDLNIYGQKTDVYLNGGPARPGAAGIPDGLYYIQVTTPDGALLGTTVGAADPTPAHVTNGVFEACYRLWTVCIKASDGTQGYDTTSNPGGEYKVWVSQDMTFANNAAKTDNFKVRTEEPPPPPPNPTRLVIHKFYDANADGVFNASDTELTGWKVSYTSDGVAFTVRYTDVDDEVSPGTYTVYEFPPLQGSWFPTTSVQQTVTLNAGETREVWFGNLCLGQGGGRTLGFWSNKNGAVLFGADDQAELAGACLRTASGGDFDPLSYSQFRSWILNATAVNMAYMLSAQYAAAFLNGYNGLVSADAIVYAPGTQSANNLGFATYGALLGEANGALCSDGYTLDGNPDRAYQAALKNALDAANNNLTFVQASPCPFGF